MAQTQWTSQNDYAAAQLKVEDDTTWEEEEEEDGCFVDQVFTLEPNVYGSLALSLAKVNPNAMHLTFAAILVMFTLFSQAAFMLMVSYIATDEYTDKYNTGVFKQAHGRACKGTEISYLEEKIDNLKKFAHGNLVPTSVFGLLALMYWAAAVIKGLRDACSFAMILLIRDPNQTLTLQDDGKDTYWIGNWKLKVVVVVVGICRVVVLVLLGYVGAMFLSYTDVLKDFILNCVALGFVIDAPTMLYNAFASNVEKKDLDTFGTIEIHARVPAMAWEWSGRLSVLLGIVGVAVPYGLVLLRFRTTLIAASIDMCLAENDL